MIKGVNKRIVEVSCESMYFEKAVLFLRSDVGAVNGEELAAAVEQSISMAENGICCKKSKAERFSALLGIAVRLAIIVWAVSGAIAFCR